MYHVLRGSSISPATLLNVHGGTALADPGLFHQKAHVVAIETHIIAAALENDQRIKGAVKARAKGKESVKKETLRPALRRAETKTGHHASSTATDSVSTETSVTIGTHQSAGQ